MHKPTINYSPNYGAFDCNAGGTAILADSHPLRTRARGFALVVTLTLMILLTMIAVGLLTLSSISLRGSTQGQAMAAARANARVALMLAIGDLQKQLGPDTRVSVTADQASGSDPLASSTPQSQRHWTGAYEAWPADSDTRPTPTFLQWFVSGAPEKVKQVNFPSSAAASGSKDLVEILSRNCVGESGDPVQVPLLSQSGSNG